MTQSFGAMLLQVHKEFANKPAMALDEAMKARVLEWSERELSALGVVEIEAAPPFEVEQ